MSQFKYLESFNDRGTDWVSLESLDPESNFGKIELGFTDNILTRMLFEDNLGQTSLIIIYDADFNKPIDLEIFNFLPPDDVDVVGKPILQ